MSYRVKDFMERDIVTIDSKASAFEASKIMVSKRVSYLIVLESDQPTGIITEWDLILKVMAEDKEPSKIMISEIMSKPMNTIDPDATVEEAMKIMIEHGIRRLPVARGNIFYGIFTGRDIAKHFNEYEEKVANEFIKHMSLFSRLLARGSR